MVILYDLMETFGEWLKKQLKIKNLSQQELAERSGITAAQISRIISGTRGIGQDSLVSISRALRLPTEEVFRAAGLLPNKGKDDELAARAEHLLRSFKTEQYRQIALATLETLLDQEEKAAYNAGLKPAER